MTYTSGIKNVFLSFLGFAFVIPQRPFWARRGSLILRIVVILPQNGGNREKSFSSITIHVLLPKETYLSHSFFFFFTCFRARKRDKNVIKAKLVSTYIHRSVSLGYPQMAEPEPWYSRAAKKKKTRTLGNRIEKNGVFFSR